MTSDAKLPIQTWVMSAGAAFRLHVGSEPSGDWCKADDVCGLVERMEEGQRVIIRKLAEKKLAAQEQAIWMESERDKAEAQRDRLESERDAVTEALRDIIAAAERAWMPVQVFRGDDEVARDDIRHEMAQELADIARKALADVEKEAT